MMLRCVMICCLLFISSIALGENVQSIVGSTALSGVSETSQESKSGGLFYLADNFSQLKILPSFTFAAPSGLVPGFGTVFFGLSGVASNTHFDKGDVDGGFSVGGGFGDPFKAVGGYASLALGSVNPADGGFGDRGSLGLGLGHTFSAFGLGVSAGVTNIDLWHGTSAQEIQDPSFYGSVTKLLTNDIAPVVLTAGAGNSMFGNINSGNLDSRKYDIKEFVAAAVYVLPQLSLVADYTSGVTTGGVSCVPCPNYPVVIGLAANNIFSQGAGGDINALVTIGCAFSF